MSYLVLLLRNPNSTVVAQLRKVLEDYFGSQRVDVQSNLPKAIDPHAVIVVLLSGDDQAEATGLPLDNPQQLELSGLPRALAQDRLVLPILLDGASMPALEKLPESLRKLGLSHALPLRTGGELPRDLGRVVRDLEEHLGFHPDNVYPWDLWLLPLGVVASLICAPFAIFWLLDVWYWNYGYETVNAFRRARWVLETIGPFALGCGLLIWAYALGLRRYRHYLRRRTDYFRSGSGAVPHKPNIWLSVALGLAIASLGFGAWSAIPATALAIASCLPSRWQPRPTGRTFGLVAIIVCLSCGSVAWSTWRTRELDRFERCLDAYQRGVEHLEAGNPATAENMFDEAIRIAPWFGHSYQGLATLAAQDKDWEAAVQQLTRAIEHYPTSQRGFFEPDHDKVAQAYENRSKLRRVLGQTELADADQQLATEVDPWLDLFGGLFRVW